MNLLHTFLRRYEEFTQWVEYVQKHFPEADIPKGKKERNRFKKKVETSLLADPQFKELHDSFCTKISLAVELVKAALEHGLPFETVLFDSWYLAPDLISLLNEKNKNWISGCLHRGL